MEGRGHTSVIKTDSSQSLQAIKPQNAEIIKIMSTRSQDHKNIRAHNPSAAQYRWYRCTLSCVNKLSRARRRPLTG